VLAVADPVPKLVRLRDANDYAEVSGRLEPVIELARRYNCHLLLSHHLGKADRTDGDDILGSTAIFGAVDTAVILKRRDHGRTIQTIQRYGEDLPETVIGLEEDGSLTVLGEVAGILLRQAYAAVLASIGEQDELTEAEIREKVGGNSGQFGKAIRQLHEEGTLTRTGAGKRGDPYRYSRRP